MSYHGATGLPSATQEAVDKDCHVIDVHLAIQVTVGGNIASASATEQHVDKHGNIVDAHLAISIHITADDFTLLGG